MRYENRQPPEGINTSREPPLKQFAKLLISALVLVVLLVVVLQFSGSWLARKVPFSAELSVMDRMQVDFGSADASPQMVNYLNDLAARLIEHMPVPADMSVRVHYSTDDTFNAFATMGGNLMFYRGLVKDMDNENTLAMVMAHEIAHVMHRDPIAGLGGGLASAVALLMITGQAGTGTAGDVLSSTGALGTVQFTRSMERAADRAALAAVQGLYGHVGGASALFEMFQQARGSSSSPDWLERFASTHPLDADRIAAIEAMARDQEWRTKGPLTPLPAGFKRWMQPVGG